MEHILDPEFLGGTVAINRVPFAPPLKETSDNSGQAQITSALQLQEPIDEFEMVAAHVDASTKLPSPSRVDPVLSQLVTFELTKSEPGAKDKLCVALLQSLSDHDHSMVVRRTAHQ